MRRIGKLTSIFLCFLMVAMTFTMAVPVNVIAEDPGIPEEDNGWWIEGTGTYFEITDSEYLNIALTSSEIVYVFLESIPRMVSFSIETESTATSTAITLTGFEISKTYYRYQDGYLQEEFTADGTGSYSYTQDLSIAHHVYIQEEPSTLYISSDYTFTGDIYDSIVITADNIIIDGNGYNLYGSGSGYGIYLNGRSGITITNVKVSGSFYGYGIALYSSSSNTISGNSVSGPWYGIYLESSSSNTISGNTNSGCTFGIWLRWSSGNTISGNTVSDNNWGGIALYSSTSNTISGNTFSGNFQVSIGMNGSHGNTISGNTVSSNNYGIWLQWATNNLISGNTVSHNSIGGIYLQGTSNGNTIFHNNLIDNVNQFINPQSTITWDNGAGEGNFWSDYNGLDDGSGGRSIGDGIGDTEIPHLGVDFYPLMEIWTPDPVEIIERLGEYIEGLELQNGLKNSLLSQLNAAENAISNDHENTVRNILNAFINHVEALSGSGKLTQEQNLYIISKAQKIVDNIQD